MPTKEFLVRAIIVHDNNILLCKNIKNPNHSYYFLPGGHMEADESPETALEREIREEIGESILAIQKIGEFDNVFTEDTKTYDEHTYVYLTTLKNYEHIHGLEGHLSFEWIPLDRVMSLDFKPEEIKESMLKDIEKNRRFWIK